MTVAAGTVATAAPSTSMAASMWAPSGSARSISSAQASVASKLSGSRSAPTSEPN